jgi:hypothetical protein
MAERREMTWDAMTRKTKSRMRRRRRRVARVGVFGG